MKQIIDQERRASDILYDEIAASRNSIRRENIRAIKEVCDQMEKDSVQIAAAEVVRRCGPDGPAYSTVCNTGSKLGEYIKLRINEQLSNFKGTQKRGSLADTLLDPVLQAQVRDKESLARWLKKENDALRTLFKNLRPGVDIDGAIAKSIKGGDELKIGIPTSENTINNEALAPALLKLMDHLVGGRQYSLNNGRLTINKKVILDKPEVSAFRDASKLSQDDWSRRYEGAGATNG